MKSNSDTYLELAFGTTDPCLARFGHCLLRGSDTAIDVIAQNAREPIAVWGDRPWFDATGNRYVPKNNPDPVREFELWKLPQNQNCALQYSKYRNSSEFVMIVSALLSQSVVTRPLDDFSPEDGAFSYYKYIQLVCDWIPALRWAYIPLSDELEEAIFVVSEGERQLLAEVESGLQGLSIQTGKLKRNKNGWQWPFMTD